MTDEQRPTPAGGSKPASGGQEFADRARRRPPGLASEFVYFLAHNRKWWLAPIVLVLLVVGLLIILGGTPAGPFIYSLF